ncbi:MAG: ATP-binding cassette domain-containing protein [bacterium]
MNQIRVEGLTKVYKKYGKPYHVLLEKARLMKPVNTITALDNVSFEMERGESAAVVGSNGAGKTTLMKTILGIARPTSGFVSVAGDLTAIMVLGLGTHDFFSGAFNIYLFGTMIGMKKAEIRRKFDEIVSFAELEKFVNMPLRTYSAGMRLRLVFSVMIFKETDGYVIDETLAFSDLGFQQRCVQKLKERRKNGTTILIASHDLPLIRTLTDRVLWIRGGNLIEDGPTENVLTRYERSYDIMNVWKEV